MEMKKIACAILFAAASVSAVMADEVAAPAPSPASGASASLPIVGSLVGASLASFIAFSSVASLVLLALVCSRITVLAFDDALAPLPAMATCFLFGFVCRCACIRISSDAIQEIESVVHNLENLSKNKGLKLLEVEHWR
ncbi:hypothetical protein POTOM_032902 [Populus tomentosa]|uniref:Uncharacterized protein n=1 Tax=Populus tomentosa TaxID=118781 RepID=A0A8X7Z115_POPTO|nr:hypothetical protein POTOM_032902 [Populus tomentosa]